MVFLALLLILTSPLPRTTPVSSSFGEFRATHLHGGIDFSTGGRVGLPIRAAADGTIRNLRITWRGYGRVIYMEHAGSWTTVYAHLSTFSRKIERQIKPILKEKGPFPGWVDLPQPVRIKRGEIIGTTGESGEGLPHLHFEVRHNNHPVDPLNYFSSPDSAAPFFVKLHIIPATVNSSIEGSTYPVTLSIPVKKTIQVHGPFALALTAGRKVGHYTWGLNNFTLDVDGTKMAGMTMKTINYDWFTSIGLLFRRSSMKISRAPATYWLTPPGNTTIPILHGPRALDLSPGIHTILITSGKRKTRVRLKVSPVPQSPGAQAGPSTFLITHFITNGHPRDYPSKPGILIDTPLTEGGRVGAGRAVTLAPFFLTHQEPQEIPLILSLTADPPPVPSPLLTPVVRIGPMDLPLTKRLLLTFNPRGDVDQNRTDLYRWRKRWYPLHAEWKDDSLVGRTRIPGTYAVILDDTPPAIGRITIRGKRVIVHVDDALSGLDWDAVSITSGKRRSVLLYDPDRHVATGALPGRPFTVTALDRAGNGGKKTHK